MVDKKKPDAARGQAQGCYSVSCRNGGLKVVGEEKKSGQGCYSVACRAGNGGELRLVGE